MANANYKLTIGPLIDTIFVLEIGGKYADVDELEDTLNDVFYTNTGIRVRLELGGVVGQKWSLEITVDEDSGNTLKTVPEKIEGKIGPGGGSRFDRTCPLV